MKSQISDYLKQVMRHSRLSRREKMDWIAEMSAHLEEETLKLIQCGYTENEAIRAALQNFGEPSSLRKKIARETFGLSNLTIWCFVVTSLVMFFVGMYLLRQSFHPPGWIPPKQWNSDKVVYFFTSVIPLSPSLMLSLCISSVFIFKTRCRKDRIGILVTFAIYCAMWFMMRMRLSSDLNSLFFGFRDMIIIEPWVLINSGILIAWGMVLYFWTKNAWVSLLPTVVSLAVGLWFPIFFIPSSLSFQWVYEGVAIRCMPIVVLLLLFKFADKHLTYRRDLTTS